MDPRLLAIAGPSKDAQFALSEEEFTIGRDSSNRLAISDLALSRRHCLIRRQEGQFTVFDLGSLNGSRVNGVPIKERVLQHGDRIEIGDSVLLFLLEPEQAEAASTPVQLDAQEWISRSTVQLRVEDAVYLKPHGETRPLQDVARAVRDLDALLKISTTLQAVRDLADLENRLLESVFEIVPAERGAILLTDANQEEPISVLGRSRDIRSNQPVRVSRTIVERVLRERTGILSNDILESSVAKSPDSLIASRVRSLICVPMEAFGRKIGVLYLDATDPSISFDDGHLQLIAAIASIAAIALENARHTDWLIGENRRLQSELRIEHDMVGESPRMQEVYQWIAKVAPTDSTVLIRGESGTGKELAARAIHLNSARSEKPFVAINCAALTETLLESELFGHEKGAFTGAVSQKKGKLEIADGGTVLLDEVAELSPLIQAKLLRVLQQREFEHVGGTRTIKVDVRLIAATNKDLEEAIRGRGFRQDLYYRLNVVTLTMPPLRERREDISLLSAYFALKFGQKCKRRVTGISAEARACLMAYDWPGNVRELENAIERAVVLGSSESILPEDLPEAVLETEPAEGRSTTRFHDAVKATKRQLILNAIEQAQGNFTEAAKLLSLHPNYLHRLIRNLNVRPELKGER